MSLGAAPYVKVGQHFGQLKWVIDRLAPDSGPSKKILPGYELLGDFRGGGRYEFLLTVNPLRVVGGTGSPVNPVAVL